MKIFVIILYFFLHFQSLVFCEASISPILFFLRNDESGRLAKQAHIADPMKAPVTVRFANPPDYSTISELEKHGLVFKRANGNLLHTKNVYLATVDLESLESLAQYDEISCIESIYNPSRTSTLDVSNPMVQASQVLNLTRNSSPIDGSGIILADVDTGIDIYHPAFFKPDGGTYNWIDANGNEQFDPRTDAVDLDGNGLFDAGETLDFFDAPFKDNYEIMINDDNVVTPDYDADIDWLYNDKNGNGNRDYGLNKDFTEDSPSYGELLFIISDDNGNNRLDIGEQLTALGTSKIVATYDKTGKHYRGVDLLTSTGDTANHGTPSFGIVGGQYPGRKFVGMAPGIEFISINRLEVEHYLEGVFWAIENGADMVMYEFGSWVYEFLDGSSNTEVIINGLHEQGIHQFMAAGNLAGPLRKKHSFFTMESYDADTLHFSIPESSDISDVYISVLWKGSRLLWGPSVTLILSDSESVKLFSGDPDGIDEYIGNIKVQSAGISSVKEIAPEIKTHRLDIVISSNDSFHGDMSLIFRNDRRIELEIDSYISDDKTGWANGAQFQNHLTDDGTVTSPGTAEKGITVGAFDPRGYRNEKGALSDFSSWGKTTDGRRAVDITAPGWTVFSPASHYPSDSQPGGYINFGGTSASLPHVAGCAALIMQASPGITPDELSQVLLQYALTDNFTGTGLEIPNDKWGYGKLRIYDSITKSNIATYVKDTIRPEQFIVSLPYPNPFNTSTNFEITIAPGIESPVYLHIYNILGQKIRTIQTIQEQPGNFSVSWNGNDDNGMPVASGIYIFHFYHDNNSITRKALYIK